MENDADDILPSSVCHSILPVHAMVALDSANLAEARRRARQSPTFLLTLRTLLDDSNNSLARFAARYLEEEMRGIQSPNTLEAKSRDLVGFETFG